MKKIFEIALGIVTSVGGFLEIGSITTAAQAGGQFGFQLLWAIALGGLCLVFLVEMSGRFSAVSGHTIAGAVRERFGFDFFVFPLVILSLVTLLVLAAEIGGVCVSLEWITGISYQYWAIPVGFLVWMILWKGTFGLIEKGVALLGLVTLCFVIGAHHTMPDWMQAGKSLLPSLPKTEGVRYWFLAVSILGASISPYLFYFYSSGAIEDKWNEGHLTVNKIIAVLGMGFGTIISMSVLIVAAMLFQARGMHFEHYDQVAVMLVPLFGRWGFYLVAGSVFIACLGAALEISLEMSYFIAQGLGWNWGENTKPKQAARFTFTYTVVICAAVLLMLIGIDPLKLTILSMALTAASLPLAAVPFLALMNDKNYVRQHTNGRISNFVVLFIIALAFVLAIVSIPLEFFGG